MALLTLLLVLAAGGAVLLGYRIYRERRDAAYSDPSSGVTFSTELPLSPPAPFARFPELLVHQPYDVMQMTDEGFEVAYFTIATGHRNRVVRPCALIDLPVDPPRFEMAEGGTVPGGVGPRAAEELRYLAGARVTTASYALLVVSLSAPDRAVQRTALRLAKALVADAGASASVSTTS